MSSSILFIINKVHTIDISRDLSYYKYEFTELHDYVMMIRYRDSIVSRNFKDK